MFQAGNEAGSITQVALPIAQHLFIQSFCKPTIPALASALELRTSAEALFSYMIMCLGMIHHSIPAPDSRQPVMIVVYMQGELLSPPSAFQSLS